jgi:hypothetical protein
MVLQPVTEATEVARLEHQAQTLVEDSWHLRTEALAARRWVVVPVEKGRHLEIAEATALADVLRLSGYQACFAVLLEMVEGEPSY